MTHHQTPETRDTWRDLAVKAVPDLAGKPLQLGTVQPGEEGAYAARRVWWPTVNGHQSSILVVARDERPSSGKAATRLDGASWWPYAVWGCYDSCGPDCERHGDEHPSHQVSA